MAATGITIDVDSSAGTIDQLRLAIERRQAVLKETTSDAVIATTITVLRSLKAATPTAKLKAKPGSYAVTKMDAEANIRTVDGKRRWVIVRGGHTVRDIFPVNQMHNLKPPGKVFKITLANPNVPWTKTKNKGAYYIMCPDLATATAYAKARVEHLLKKEAGMARYALAIAQAKVSDRGELVPPSGSKAMQTAYAASAMTVNTQGFASGSVSVDFVDRLNYSAPAAKISVEAAIQKAVNSTTGMLNRALANKGIHEQFTTPFSTRARDVK